jgi:hypothetical protein
MVEQDITLYAGQDFSLTYVVPTGSDMDLSQYEAVCKIRKRPYDDMKLELTPVVQSKQVGFFISGMDSAKAQLKGGDYLYDAFIYNDHQWIKLGQGTVTIVPDISMHK